MVFKYGFSAAVSKLKNELQLLKQKDLKVFIVEFAIQQFHCKLGKNHLPRNIVWYTLVSQL